MEELVSEDKTLATYAQPLSRLQVSWGAILAGALTFLAVSFIVFGLAFSIILTATSASAGSMKGALIAAFVCSLVTTLIGAFAGGAVAGYLPGNPRRIITIAHGFLAWALAFLVSTAIQIAIVGGITRTATSAVASTAGAAVQASGAAVGAAAGGQTPIDQRAVSVLQSLGYSATEARQMVESARTDAQRVIRGNAPEARAQAAETQEQVRGALDKVISSLAVYTWLWWGTWMLAGVLAMAGAGVILPRVRKVPERELLAGREPLHVATLRHVHGTP